MTHAPPPSGPAADPQGTTGVPWQTQSLHMNLYAALKGIHVSDEQAREVVNSLEKHLDLKLGQATQTLQHRVDSLQAVLAARIDAIAEVKAQTDAARERRGQLVRWVIGTAVAVVAATLGTLRAFNVL